MNDGGVSGNSGRASGALPDTGCFECAGASAARGAVSGSGRKRRRAAACGAGAAGGAFGDFAARDAAVGICLYAEPAAGLCDASGRAPHRRVRKRRGQKRGAGWLSGAQLSLHPFCTRCAHGQRAAASESHRFVPDSRRAGRGKDDAAARVHPGAVGKRSARERLR